jgi:hypothetical protein
MQISTYHLLTDGVKSYFETRSLDFASVAGVGGAAAFPLGDGDVSLVMFTAGYEREFHHPPAPTWALILRGHLEIELGDGESRTLAGGDVVLFADTAGRGHKARVVGDEDVVLATVGYPTELLSAGQSRAG